MSAALDACKKGIALLTAQQKTNKALVDDYNTRLTAWEARRDAANTVRNANKTSRQNAQTDWDNRKQNHKNDALKERQNAGCGACGTNPGCPSGWEWAGRHGCGWGNMGCENECKRSDAEANAEANRRTGGSRPEVYDDPPFSEGKPTESAQNQTPINIACCENTLNVIGSEVTETNITQQNECKADLEKKASAPPTPPPTSAPTSAPPTFGTPPPPPATSSGTSAPATSSGTPQQKKIFVVIVLVIVSLILLSSCSGLLLMI